MNKMKFYFRPTSLGVDPGLWQEQGKEYLVTIPKNQMLMFRDKPWTRLLFPKDNSVLSKQIKKLIDKPGEGGDLLATPFTNLKFSPDFSDKLKDNFSRGHALLIKDPSQVENLEGTNHTSAKPTGPYQITFKVLNQHKEGFGSGKGGKKYSYQESFSKHGQYTHVLEIEPLDLGIESLPPITRLIFNFDYSINRLGPGVSELTKCELYKSPTLENSAGKTFTMEVKFFNLHSSKNNLKFNSNENYVFGSLVEKKEQNNPDKNSSPTETKNDNSNPPSSTWPKVLIIGGVIGLLVLTIIILIKLLINKFSIQKIFN